MKFSVLMSVYSKERSEYLIEAVESVFNQSLQPDELILVEDGPLNNDLYTALDSLCSKFSKIKRISLEINSGLGTALNEGLTHCSNELVARMDSDDICYPTRFEKQLSFMMQNPDIDVCSSWIQEFEGDITNTKAIKKVPATHEEISEYAKLRNPLNHPSVVFRKKAVLDVGGYKPFLLFEDYYLWVRMMVNGCKLANVQECLVYFRVSSEMYKRRGGFKYARVSAKFQWILYKLKVISATTAIKSSILRGLIYTLPNSLRSLFYTKILRS